MKEITIDEFVQGKMPKRIALSKDIRRKVYKKTDGHCAYCGCELEYKDMQVDHVESLYWYNGTNDLDNLMPACRPCNLYKSTQSVESMKENLALIPQRLIRDSSTFRLALKYGLITINEKPIEFYFEGMEEKG